MTVHFRFLMQRPFESVNSGLLLWLLHTFTFHIWTVVISLGESLWPWKSDKPADHQWFTLTVTTRLKPVKFCSVTEVFTDLCSEIFSVLLTLRGGNLKILAGNCSRKLWLKSRIHRLLHTGRHTALKLCDHDIITRQQLSFVCFTEREQRT